MRMRRFQKRKEGVELVARRFYLSPGEGEGGEGREGEGESFSNSRRSFSARWGKLAKKTQQELRGNFWI